MKRAIVFLLVGVAIGELDPLGWVAWQALEQRLPDVKQQSLAKPSPFQSMARSTWVAESEHAYVVEDRYVPTAPVHLLVIPKERYTSVLEPPTELLGEMLDLARRSAQQFGIAESGFRIIINTNPHASQSVYHLHVHVKGGRQLRDPLLPPIWGRLKMVARCLTSGCS